MTGTAATALASTHLYLQEVLFKITAHKTVDHMDTSNSSARLSGSSCIPQSDTSSSVPELADANSIQPSSAAAERVFSLLQSSFGKQQEQSLEDYIELSVMMQYNYRNDH